MIIVKFLRFFLGCLRITVSGRFPERFLNMCAANNVTIWNTRRRGENIECTVFARDYKKIRHFRKKCGVLPRIKSKHGLPFIRYRYRRRKGVLCGAALCALYLAVMPNFLWSIDVQGNSRVSADEITAALQKIGVEVGVPLDGIDVDNMRQQLILELPELSWAAINLSGTKATVDVREKLDVAPSEDKLPCNLTAARDGRIISVKVSAGSAAVKVGDAVTAGDPLVMGTVEYKSGYTAFRHSAGEIIAETNRRITVSVPLSETLPLQTGRVRQKSVLQLFWFKIPLYLGSEQYSYVASAEQNPLILSGERLPMSLTTATFAEVTDCPVNRTEEQAQELALQRLEQRESDDLEGTQVAERSVKTECIDGQLVLTADYICRENIAKVEYIEFSEK